MASHSPLTQRTHHRTSATSQRHNSLLTQTPITYARELQNNHFVAIKQIALVIDL
jgi:hypothetical protein